MLATFSDLRCHCLSGSWVSMAGERYAHRPGAEQSPQQGGARASRQATRRGAVAGSICATFFPTSRLTLIISDDSWCFPKPSCSESGYRFSVSACGFADDQPWQHGGIWLREYIGSARRGIMPTRAAIITLTTLAVLALIGDWLRDKPRSCPGLVFFHDGITDCHIRSSSSSSAMRHRPHGTSCPRR